MRWRWCVCVVGWWLVLVAVIVALTRAVWCGAGVSVRVAVVGVCSRLSDGSDVSPGSLPPIGSRWAL